jgi:hypothetical protein
MRAQQSCNTKLPGRNESNMSKSEENVVYGLSGRTNSNVSGCTYDDLHSARTLLGPTRCAASSFATALSWRR